MWFRPAKGFFCEPQEICTASVPGDHPHGHWLEWALSRVLSYDEWGFRDPSLAADLADDRPADAGGGRPNGCSKSEANFSRSYSLAKKQGFRPEGIPVRGTPVDESLGPPGVQGGHGAEMELDGVLVWLEWPVLRIGIGPTFPAHDLESVVYPLLKPSKLPPGRRFAGSLSAGHGGRIQGTWREPGRKRSTR